MNMLIQYLLILDSGDIKVIKTIIHHLANKS